MGKIVRKVILEWERVTKLIGHSSTFAQELGAI